MAGDDARRRRRRRRRRRSRRTRRSRRRPPWPPRRRRASSRSFTTMWAPSAARRRANAAPRPEPHPVMMAIRPWSGRSLTVDDLKLPAVATASSGHEPSAHRPERDFRCSVVLHPGLPLAAVRPGEPLRRRLPPRACSARPTGSTATSPGASTRCPSSARSSTRPPTACCSSCASAASSSTAARPLGVQHPRRRARGRSSASRWSCSPCFGMKRFDVSWWGKAGTFGLMVAFPVLPARARPATAPVNTFFWVLRLGGRHPRPGVQLLRRHHLRPD